MNRTPALRALLFVGLLALLVPASASAQIVKPWAPASDTLMQLASAAKLRFKRQLGDSVGGYNYEAYDLVGQAGRRLLQALGREHLLQAAAIEPTLDSLGLDVEVANDATMPSIVFMLVRNPYRPTSDAIGYLYWYRGKSLRMQGVSFPPSRRFSVHSWWSGRYGAPYETGLIFRRHTTPDSLGFRLLRLGADGNFWDLVDYERHGPRMGGDANASLIDVDGDDHPELVVFQGEEPDSFLTAQVRNGVPPLLAEYLYTERPEGFVLHDVHAVPTLTSVLRLFALTLTHHDLPAARRLLLHPETLDEALANGWDKATGVGAWNIEYAEENQAWPEWFEVRIRTGATDQRWAFHFIIKDDRWVIRNWVREQQAPTTPRDPAPGTTR